MREKVTGHVEIGVFQQRTTGVLFFWIAPVAFTTKGRGLTFTFARVLVEHKSMGQACNPPTKNGPHEVCSPCSRAHFGRVPTACVSSPRDRAVSTGSHMQDMDISKAPPHLGARTKIGDSFP